MRVFVAIDLPLDLKEKIFAVSQKVAKDFPLRPVVEENLHLTMVFLGYKTEEEVEKIKKAVSEATSGFGKIFLKVDNLEFFPPSRPRGIWFKISGQKDKLASLHKKIVDSLLKNGIRVDDLRFTPHTCIGRLKTQNSKLKTQKIETERIKLGETFVAEKVAVFESKLSPKGPSYFKLGEFGLK